MGLPLSSGLYLYGKGTYFIKNGVPTITLYSIDSSGVVTILSRTKQGTAEFRQWIFNLGVLYDLSLSDSYLLGLSAGITLAAIHESITYKDFTGSMTTSTASGIGQLGYFAGMSVERGFEKTPLSILAEAHYNISRSEVLTLVGNYGGASVALGVRYYFGDRRRK